MTALRFENRINNLHGKSRTLFFAAFLLILFPLYLYGANQQLKKINFKNYWCDQESYVWYAVRLYETDYSYAGDFNRMPLYPWLQSLHYDPSLTEDEYFDHAKVFNIWLSVVVLIGVFLIYQHFFDNLITINLMLLTTFTVYIFKAPYIQSELLFFFLNFCAFILMIKMLMRPTWWLGILAGVVFGITHLTKGSIMPGVVVFLVIYGLKMIFEASIQWRKGVLQYAPTDDSRISEIQAVESGGRRKHRPYKSMVFQRAISGLLVVIFYLAVIWPYISTSKRIYGEYLFNVNTTIYMWYDSWDDVKQGAWLYRDVQGWPDIPRDELPSVESYIREKSPGQILTRIGNGFREMQRRHIYRGGYGYVWYIFGFLLIVPAFLARVYFGPQRERLKVLIRQYFFLSLFVAGYFGGYTLLYAFYVPIHPGLRFMLSLFMPFFFVVMKLLSRPIFSISRLNVILFGVLVIHSLLNVFYSAGIIHGGG